MGSNLSYEDLTYRQLQSRITKSNWQRGIYNFKLRPLINRECNNSQCLKIFSVKPYDPKRYCSSNCAAIVNNKLRKRLSRPLHTHRCFGCNKIFTRDFRWKYCSVKCQIYLNYKTYISHWKLGNANGETGIRTKEISAHIRRYLRLKFKNRCSRCGWNKKNVISGRVPLEINHIDGNSSNNQEKNLELLCPNCHSLTPNFKNLNKGNGREWRILYRKQRAEGLQI